jgi:predicted  nucleic acid-binding Zn-ribbon protein
LLQLQEFDLAIERLLTRLAILESQQDIREAREHLSDVETRLGELQLQMNELARDQARLEADIDSMERKIAAEKKREFDGSVANPKELQAIEAEIASIKSRRSQKEDQVLDFMEKREDLGGRIAGVEVELAEAQAGLAEIEQTAGRDIVAVRQSLAEQREERQAVAADIDPELLELYEDLRRQKKGVGAAALSDGVCQGCHQMLSPMYVDRLKHSDETWRCEYCRRILVRV